MTDHPELVLFMLIVIAVLGGVALMNWDEGKGKVMSVPRMAGDLEPGAARELRIYFCEDCECQIEMRLIRGGQRLLESGVFPLGICPVCGGTELQAREGEKDA